MKNIIFALLFPAIFALSAFAQENKSLQITYKPKPRYPDKSICFQGVVRLRVEFLPDGKIGRVQPISELTL